MVLRPSRTPEDECGNNVTNSSAMTAAKPLLEDKQEDLYRRYAPALLRSGPFLGVVADIE